MDNKHHILFEDYLSGNLTKEEKESFESNLKNDRSFSEEFNIHKELSIFLKHKFQNEHTTNTFNNTKLEKKIIN